MVKAPSLSALNVPTSRLALTIGSLNWLSQASQIGVSSIVGGSAVMRLSLFPSEIAASGALIHLGLDSPPGGAQRTACISTRPPWPLSAIVGRVPKPS